MPVELEIRFAGRSAEVREFPQSRLTVGRNVGTLMLGDPQASASHAEIVVSSRGVTYFDLKSTNGSFLENGERISGPHAWVPGTSIRIGNTTLRLLRYSTPDFGPHGTLMVPTERNPTTERVRGLAAPVAPAAAASVAFSAPVITPNVLNPGTGSPAPGAVAAVPRPEASGLMPLPLGAIDVALLPLRDALESEAAGGSLELGAALAPGASKVGVDAPLAAEGGPAPAAGSAAAGGWPASSVQRIPAELAGTAISSGGALEVPRAAPAAVIVNSERAPSGLEFVVQSLRAYGPHALKGWSVLGPWALPLGLLSSLATWSETAALFLLPLTSVGYAVLFFLYGLGAQAEFAMRTYAGLPVSVRKIWSLQSRRLIPWIVELLPPLLISLLGFVFTFLAFAPMLLPVYMVERIAGLRVNTRSVDLLSRDASTVLVPFLLVFVLGSCALLSATFYLERVPVAGAALSALFAPMVLALALPFVTFMQFRAYGLTRQRREGVDVVALIRDQARR